MNEAFAAQVAALKAAIPFLPESKRDFARSLVQAGETRPRTVSQKQVYWIGELTRIAAAGSAPKAAPETVDIGDFSGMLALFDRAGKTLKRPAIALRDETAGEIRINVAGAQAQQPGTLNVVTPGGFGNGTWFGRISRNGALEKSPRVEVPATLVALLQQFAKAPAETAAAHGRLHGRCCFCAGALSDPISAAVGYGKTCAGKWGMPYSTDFARSLEPVVPVSRRKAA